jgi:hypothetical protein
MSNRTGKREREARSNRVRDRRGYSSATSRTGATLQARKLGRKKSLAFARATFARFGGMGLRCSGGPLWLHMPAIPVAEPERRGRSAEELET